MTYQYLQKLKTSFEIGTSLSKFTKKLASLGQVLQWLFTFSKLPSSTVKAGPGKRLFQYLSSSLVTQNILSTTVVIWRPRTMNTKGFGRSEGRIWQFLTVKLFSGSTMSLSDVGSFLKPMNWPLSFRMK